MFGTLGSASKLPLASALGAATLAATTGLGLLTLPACHNDGDDSDGHCEPLGAERACSCDDGRSGTMLCLPSGDHSDCHCEVARVTPCAAPGVVFDCRCEDGRGGSEICLNNGDYTPCDCEAANMPPGAGAANDAGASPQTGDQAEPKTPSSEPPEGACPDGFACVEQMGFSVCADGTGVPPLCSTAVDCAAAGLGAADCVDPGLGGVMVCAQPCQL